MVQKLEDRDKNSEAAIAATEKELNLRQQWFELHKKKVRVLDLFMTKTRINR